MRAAIVGLMGAAAMIAVDDGAAAAGASGGEPRVVGATVQSDEAPGRRTLMRRSLRFRREFGLRADRGFVRTLLHRAVSPRYGVPLTRREAREMNRRVRAQNADDRLVRYLRRCAPSSFAGLYMRHGQRGQVRVAFAHRRHRRSGRGCRRRSIAAHKRVARRVFPVPHRLRFVRASFSLSNLERIRNGVAAARSALRGDGIEMTRLSVDVRDNRVEIGLAVRDRVLAKRLRARFGRGVQVVRRAPLRTLASRQSDYPPLKGGLEILSVSEGAACTSAFVVEFEPLPTVLQYFLTTAGHCGPSGSDWQHPGWSGTMGKNSYEDGSQIDAGRIQIKSIDRSNRILVLVGGDPSNDYRDMHSQQDQDDDNVGDVVCKSGITTGTDCGELEQTDADILMTPSDILLHEQRIVSSMVSNYGDSGAPIYFDNDARGILSGGDGGTGGVEETTYGHIGNYTEEFGERVVTDPNDDLILG